MRVLISATKKIIPVNSTDGSEKKESKPIGPPIAESIKLSEEKLRTEDWIQPVITVTSEQTNKLENITKQENDIPVTPVEAINLVKLVQESTENKTKPLDLPMLQLDLNKKSEKNETVLVVQQKVNPIELVIKSAVPVKQLVKSELKSKKPVHPVGLQSANPDKANFTKPTETVKTVNMESIKKSEQKQNKPTIMRTTTTIPPNKIIPKPITQNLRGYKKKPNKVKPVAQQQDLGQNKKPMKSEPQVSTIELPVNSVKTKVKLIEKNEKPVNTSMGSEQKGTRCSRFGTC